MFLVRIPYKKLSHFKAKIAEWGFFVEMTLEYDDIQSPLRFYGLDSYIKTVHLPFFDINLGSKNRIVREHALNVLKKSIERVEKLDVKNFVFHHNYSPYHYGFMEDDFVERISEQIPLLLSSISEHSFLSMENVFEYTPYVVSKILEKVCDDRLKTCFDFGHFNLFSRVSLDAWFDSWKDSIVEFHVHNNYGVKDEHNAVNCGSFDYKKAFSMIVPDFITFENNNVDDFKRSVNIVQKLLEG